MPNGVFTSDQHAPSIRLNDEQPAEPAAQEVMEIDEASEINLEYPDWRIPILEWIVQGKLPPDKTEAFHIARHAKSFVLIDRELHR